MLNCRGGTCCVLRVYNEGTAVEFRCYRSIVNVEVRNDVDERYGWLKKNLPRWERDEQIFLELVSGKRNPF
jgi:hypothetical protein